MSIKYVTVEEVIAIHDMLIQYAGGSYGILNFHLLDSALHRAQSTFSGEKLYKDIFEEAAAILQSIVKNHPFVDGNKRTAFIVALRFLSINSYNITIPNDEVVKFLVEVDIKNHSLAVISQWLKGHLCK